MLLGVSVLVGLAVPIARARSGRVSTAKRTRERTVWDTLGILPRLAVLIVALLVTLLPIAWIVLTSFKPEGQWISSRRSGSRVTGRSRATARCGTTAPAARSSTASSSS